MTQFILDHTVTSQLANLETLVELCDPSGQVVGRFVPNPEKLNGQGAAVEAGEPAGQLTGNFWFEPTEPFLTDDELDQREQSDAKTYTTAEVLTYLESL